MQCFFDRYQSHSKHFCLRTADSIVLNDSTRDFSPSISSYLAPEMQNFSLNRTTKLNTIKMYQLYQ